MRKPRRHPPRFEAPHGALMEWAFRSATAESATGRARAAGRETSGTRRLDCARTGCAEVTQADGRAIVTAGVGGFEDPPAQVLAEAAAAFGLLASPARLHIMWALGQGECDVTSLAERVGGALPAVSQHLTKLKLAGLVRARREGRRQVYFVDDPDMVTVMRLMVGQLTDRAEHAPTRRSRGLGA